MQWCCDIFGKISWSLCGFVIKCESDFTKYLIPVNLANETAPVVPAGACRHPEGAAGHVRVLEQHVDDVLALDGGAPAEAVRAVLVVEDGGPHGPLVGRVHHQLHRVVVALPDLAQVVSHHHREAG